MDELFKLLALLVIMAFTGLSTLSKKAREKQKEMESNLPEPLSPQPWEPKKMEPRRIMTPTTKPISKPVYRPISGKSAPQSVQRPVPQPATAPEEPLWSKMLREVLDMNEPVPEPVFEPAPPVEPSRKLVRRKKGDPPQKSVSESKPTSYISQPAPPPRKVIDSRSPMPNPLTAIMERVKNEPLRAAILLSEIVQPPRAKRRRIRAM